jgi:hypothetical protein
MATTDRAQRTNTDDKGMDTNYTDVNKTIKRMLK